ncbi:MAG TPA: hypothetical protein VM260_04460 [Pirellula sp.]|nr:hypothetical protein [Pirellula sp.]
MSKSIRHPQLDSPTTFTARWRLLISCLILAHFGAIGLTYATNWRRSALQDSVLLWLQPYLIGANWYQEMLPIEWVSDAHSLKQIRISVQFNDNPHEWESVLETKKWARDQARAERFLHLLAELAGTEDTQGLTNVLKSIVLHIENGRSSNILKIRIEKTSDSLAENEEENVLYEASLARFSNGEFGFVSKIDDHRTVRALNAMTGSP